MTMRRALLACSIALLAAPVLAAEGGKPGPFTHELKPGAIAEDCVKLKAGQSREFEWTSDAPVDFNIHFHDGDKVTYPLEMARQWKGRGKFTAERDQDYCWMWTGRPEKGATVIGKFKAVK